VSNHAPHPRKIQPKPGKYALYIATPMVLAIFILIPFIRRMWKVDVDPSWGWYQAEVVETRIAIIGSFDRAYTSGGVVYQVQAHVRYQANGQTQDAWFPASKPSDDRLFLELWLSQHSGKAGVVRQNPRNPADVVFVLQ
jgi:hypothetical protein